MDPKNSTETGTTRPASSKPDDGVPAGDMPPQPRWPLVAASVAWGLWIVFLLAMTWLRVKTTPV